MIARCNHEMTWISVLADIVVTPASGLTSTHGHSDHLGNNNLFLDSLHIVGKSVSKGHHYLDEKFPLSIDDGVVVCETPGHTLDSVSVIVNTPEG